jgi:hypothetical protein
MSPQAADFVKRIAGVFAEEFKRHCDPSSRSGGGVVLDCYSQLLELRKVRISGVESDAIRKAHDIVFNASLECASKEELVIEAELISV